MDRSLSQLQEFMKDREPWSATVHGVTHRDITGWLNNNSVETVDYLDLTA